MSNNNILSTSSSIQICIVTLNREPGNSRDSQRSCKCKGIIVYHLYSYILEVVDKVCDVAQEIITKIMALFFFYVIFLLQVINL